MARFNIVGRDKKVETDVLVIEDNILRWANTIIQISNIAFITSFGEAKKPFPFLSIIPLALGIYILVEGSKFGLVFLAGVTLWIVFWFIGNQKADEKAILSISLNSGMTYSILFNDKKFLRDVMKQLASLISQPFSHKNFTINIKDSTFKNGSSVIQNLRS